MHTWTVFSNPVTHIYLRLLFIRYTLWYQTTCPQPSQPFPVSTCVFGSLVQIFSGNQLNYVYVGTDMNDHPLPYMRYRFLLQAENNVSGVNSSFTDTIETTESSMCYNLSHLHIIPGIHLVL